MRTMKEQRASTRKTMKFLNDLSKVSNVEIDALLKNDAGEVIGCMVLWRDITLDGKDKL